MAENSHSSTINLMSREDRRGSGIIKIIKILFKNSAGDIISECSAGQDLIVEMSYVANEELLGNKLVCGIMFKDVYGIPIFNSHNRMNSQQFPRNLGNKGVFHVRLKDLPLPEGKYYIKYALLDAGVTYLDSIDNAASINIVGGTFFSSGELPPSSHGKCLVRASWSAIKTPQG
jgi:lipopolysaccharide transport system ATP-binding protein